MSSREQAYWDHVGDDWRRRRPHQLWRSFTDRHQLELLDRWVGAMPLDVPEAGHRPRLLKTDLFDEVAGRGLVGDLVARGWAVTGIDLSPLVVAEAEARNAGLEAVVADVRSLPFADCCFDAVFSGSTLDHFESEGEIAGALCELSRVLRPGGRLVLTLDNPGNPLIWLRNGPLSQVVRRLGIVPYQVGRTLHRRPLVEALQAAGFEVRQLDAVLHCPRAIAVALAGPVRLLGAKGRAMFVRMLGSFEVLERLPTRWRTGHYLAVHAVRGLQAGRG
jgi:SAM-dependent methyltransferase